MSEIESKPWYASRGVWGGLVAVLSAVGGLFGYQIVPEDQEAIILALTGIGGAIGGIVAVVGRVLASKKVG